MRGVLNCFLKYPCPDQILQRTVEQILDALVVKSVLQEGILGEVCGITFYSAQVFKSRPKFASNGVAMFDAPFFYVRFVKVVPHDCRSERIVDQGVDNHFPLSVEEIFEVMRLHPQEHPKQCTVTCH